MVERQRCPARIRIDKMGDLIVHEEPETWQKAREVCARDLTTLASLPDRTTLDHVIAALERDCEAEERWRKMFWVGLVFERGEGSWDDGTAYESGAGVPLRHDPLDTSK